ncbi:dipeptidase [Vibrio sp. JCM 19236]|nr:dipeptidase [Vibrio sp. JCM 19236]
MWNPRGKSKEELAKRVAFLTEAYVPTRTPEQEARAAKAKAKYGDSVVINSVMPASIAPVLGMSEKHLKKGLDENREAGMTIVSPSLFNTTAIFKDTLPQVIKDTDKLLAKEGVQKAGTIADIRNLKAKGEMGVVYNTQGGDFVTPETMEEDVKFAQVSGIRIMNTSYNNDTLLGGGGANPENNGLTEEGLRFVKYANEQGIVLDCSHASDQACIDTAKASKYPMVASHSNAKAVYNHFRNLSDEAIIAIGENGGAVCPTGTGGFLSEDGSATPEIFAEHLVHVADLIGKDKVCYSTDAVHNVSDFYQMAMGMTDTYPPEKGLAAPIQNLHAKHVWDVVAVLEDKYGWNVDEINGFLGENLMRVYAANWNKQEPASWWQFWK